MKLSAAGRYSVCQFLADGIEEWVRRNVTVDEACHAAKHYTTNVAAKFGITERVIITNSEGKICYDWRKGKGVIFL